MPRKEGDKQVSPKVIEAVKAVRIMNPDYGAKQILKAIDKNRKAYFVNGDRLPSEGGVYKILRENKNEIDTRRAKNTFIPNKQLDTPWSVGSCLQSNIPPAMVPLLIEIQQVFQGRELTIRQCRWIAFLYQSVTASEVLKNKWEPDQLKENISIMAEMFAKREKMGEIMGKTINTSDLDIFFSNDVDSLKLWLKTFAPEQYKKDAKAANEFQPLSREVLMSILGMNELTQESVNVFNEWLQNQFLSQIEPQKASAIDKILLKQHPEIRPVIESWYKWIEANEKEGN
jgi:hypothetical protein